MYWFYEAVLGQIFACLVCPSAMGSRCSTRSSTRRHEFQLVDFRNKPFLEIQRRSALGLVWVYNRLPARIVAQKTVKGFQSMLQGFLKERVVEGSLDWRELFSPRTPVYRHLLR